MMNVKGCDFLTDILAEWKIKCDNQHSKITFFSCAPSLSWPPQHSAFDLAGSIAFCSNSLRLVSIQCEFAVFKSGILIGHVALPWPTDIPKGKVFCHNIGTS